MRTLKFNDVIYQAAQLMGFNRANIPQYIFNKIRDMADLRLGVAWEAEFWPELIRIGELAVTQGDSDYITLTSAMGEVLGVFDDDPIETTKFSEVDYRLYEDGTNRLIYVYGSSDTPLWVRYRITRPHLRGDLYAATSTYISGDQVLFEGTDGHMHFYDANTTVIENNSPTQAPSSWDVVEIPLIFQQYLVQGVLADFMRANSVFDEAGRVERKATNMLELEADKIYRQQKTQRRIQV